MAAAKEVQFLVAGVSVVFGIFVAFALRWTFRLIFPTVYSYPWPELDDSEKFQYGEFEQTVLMAGSFNPPHLGHIEMIRYLTTRFGKVIVVVGHNPDKTYDVSPDQRVDLLQKCLGDFENVSIRIVAGYVWKGVPEAGTFFRGIRSWKQDGAEERKLQLQNMWGPIVCGPFWLPRNTCFLKANPAYSEISSTKVREVCSNLSASTTKDKPRGGGKGDPVLNDYVPECIAMDVRKLYCKKSN